MEERTIDPPLPSPPPRGGRAFGRESGFVVWLTGLSGAGKSTVASRLLARGGGVAITAAISPYREIRDEIRAQTPNFVEVFVRCSLDDLVRRDVKGLYRKALAGEISNFTGVSDPYEEPLRPEVVVDTEQQTAAESLESILRQLQGCGLVATPFREVLVAGSDLEVALEETRGLPRLAVDARAAADVFMI